MNQRTHAWIAIRAIQLLKDEGSVPDLVSLLEPHAKEAAIGAWIPDKRDAKLGSGATQNHVFKIGPYTGPDALKSRFVLTRSKMMKFLGTERKTAEFINTYGVDLDDNWWKAPYKATPPPGKHLANRAMALDITTIDLLILGDPDVQKLLRKRVDFLKYVAPGDKSREEQVALFFFMLSHFIADALMPCHCDERDLSDYGKGLHEKLEEHWGDIVGDYFEEENLVDDGVKSSEVIKKAAGVGKEIGLTFGKEIPTVRDMDIWETIVLLCRASFSVASIIAPYNVYKYKPDDKEKASFKDLFTIDMKSKDMLNALDICILHDAVMNVAVVWKDIWRKFK